VVSRKWWGRSQVLAGSAGWNFELKVTTILERLRRKFTVGECYGGREIFGILGNLSENTAFVGFASV